MGTLCIFCFGLCLFFSMAFSLGCEMLVASCCCCLPVPGLWALFVVCGGVVYQAFLVVGYCLFPLFLGEVLSVFRCSGRLWSVCSLFVSWFFGFPFGNKFLFIQKKKKEKKETI